MDPQPVVVGGTYRWPLTATQQGAPWDLRNATVTLNFVKKGQTAGVAISVDVSGGSQGVVTGINPASTFTAAGFWKLSFKIVDGADVVESAPQIFEVFESVAATIP